jgi:hypothetical protein
MTDLEMWSLLVGAGLPPLVAIINQPRWAPAAKFLMTVVVAVGAGAMTAWLQGDLTGRRWVSSALVIGVTALVTYQTGWKPSTIVPRIEHATSRSNYRLAGGPG